MCRRSRSPYLSLKFARSVTWSSSWTLYKTIITSDSFVTTNLSYLKSRQAIVHYCLPWELVFLASHLEPLNMKLLLLLLYSKLSAAADVLICTFESCYATEPNLPRPTQFTGSDGISSSLIPFVWTDLEGLGSTTTIETTITQTDDSKQLITPTVSVIVQPKGYW